MNTENKAWTPETGHFSRRPVLYFIHARYRIFMTILNDFLINRTISLQIKNRLVYPVTHVTEFLLINYVTSVTGIH